MNIRIGNGYDIHQLCKGRALIIGGVEIPHELGLLGHSDADVLTHAIMDAMLGALSLGDIGHYFPPTDPQWAGADSLVLLSQVNQLVRSHGYAIGNIDSVIVAERPKLKPHIKAMTLLLAGHIGGTKTILRLVEESVEGSWLTLYEALYASRDFPDLVPIVQKYREDT